MKTTIDLATWPRKRHFELFRTFDYPHFNLCAPVDVTHFYEKVRERRQSFTICLVHMLSKAANVIPEFRYRIHGDEVVLYDVAHPSYTVMGADDLFTFCTVPYSPSRQTFTEQAVARTAWVKEHPVLEDEPGDDNLLYMTGLPWVSFTSIQHPIHMHPVDSVPRIAWGKIAPPSEGSSRLSMPLALQAHHALMDGVHAGRYFELVQRLLDDE